MAPTETAQRKFLPYGRQSISEADIEAVAEVLQSDWLTQGPAVPAFERALSETVGAGQAVVCCNGTAALHLAMLALGIGEGDVVVTTPVTFLASANCARYVGADVKFVDIDPETGLMRPDCLADLLDKDSEKRIKAVIPVHFGGQPANLPEIHAMARQHGAFVVDDACHALGASFEYRNTRYRVGGNPFSDMTVFSFHPVKHVTTGEGGAISTDDVALADRLRRFRSHGIQKEGFACGSLAHAGDGRVNPWYYEMSELGYNYRMSDIHAALGRSQLGRLPRSLERRRTIAALYDKLIVRDLRLSQVVPLKVAANVSHAYHLFVVRVDFASLSVDRAAVMESLRGAGIGTQVHYIPVHLQPYYRKHSGTKPGDFPGAEAYYAQALSLPMYPELTEADIEYVVDRLSSVLREGEISC
jgi:UDP-4-amino-4,6-dideoxy-N-acetyl-beta-L-altrosamine transaminase